MFEKKNFILIIINFSLLFILVFYIFFHASTNDVAFVNSTQLFDHFAMTREMKSLGEKSYNLQVKKIDSLYGLMNISTDQNHSAYLMQSIIREKDSLNSFQQRFVSEQSAKVWARIQSYTKDYSKTTSYKIILGSRYNDNLLYGAPEKDITAELLSYINKKYEGSE
jgi:outer membrane protein